jgi:hypothetical protein
VLRAKKASPKVGKLVLNGKGKMLLENGKYLCWKRKNVERGIS